MKLTHTCSLEWMRARQFALTASDAKELLPFTATGRPRKIGDQQYLKVLARKLVHLTDDDCISTGAAARGHILEPYAIECLNRNAECSKFPLYHWDDVIVKKSNRPYSLGFSPDAINIPQNSKDTVEVYEDSFVSDWEIGEVKCYSPENHLVKAHTPKEQLEERWQIATAMAVSERITKAYLMLYNPSMAQQLFVKEYWRSDLVNEIDTILEIEKNFLEWFSHYSFEEPAYLGSNCKEEWMMEMLFGDRSVMNPR